MLSQLKMLDQASPPLRSQAVARSRISTRRAGATADRYSRRVLFLKRMLPAVGLTLLLLVAVWPRLHPLLQQVQFGLPAIDLREARELRMVNPRYAGLDRYNRPYVVTAEAGRQVPDRNDVMALEQPEATMTVHGGASVVVTAATGVYQSQPQLLDLFDDVTLVHENGTRFVTRRGHLNLTDNTAAGHDPIEGHGPTGDISGEGFQILSKGDTIIFTGRSDILLKGTKPSAAPAAPPGLPAEIAQSAAQIENAGPVMAIAEPAARSGVAEAKPAEPGARPQNSVNPKTSTKHAAKTPAHGKQGVEGKVGKSRNAG
jgi:lipopolysaccharide export system protein LptC